MTATSETSHSNPPQALVDFALRQLRVKTNLCTLQQHERGYVCSPRILPDYNLLYLTRGRVVWTVNDREYLLRPQTLLIVPPAAADRAHSRTRRVTLVSVHVQVTLPSGQDVFELLAPPPMQRVTRHSRLDRYLRGAADEYRRATPEQALLRMPSWARLIVLELLADNAERGLLSYQPLDPMIGLLLEELGRRTDHAVNLAELSRWSGFSPQHLNRMFRAALGITPLQHHAKLRMQRAAAMLGDGRLTVRAVAKRLGFDDAYYFSRLFKQHFGTSPSRYREAAEEAAGSNYPSCRSTDPFTR